MGSVRQGMVWEEPPSLIRRWFCFFFLSKVFIMGLVDVKISIRGIVPLIMHNGQLADPMNKFSKSLKAISGKRKKTDEDYAEMAKVEWHAGLYVDKEGDLILPSSVIEATIQEGAKKQKLGKQFKSAVFADTDAKLDIGIKKKAIELWGNDTYRDTRGVKIGQSRIMRTRPIFPQWSAVLELIFDDEQVNEEDVRRAVIDAGCNVGLCDYRPKFGRFEVV